MKGQSNGYDGTHVMNQQRPPLLNHPCNLVAPSVGSFYEKQVALPSKQVSSCYDRQVVSTSKSAGRRSPTQTSQGPASPRRKVRFDPSLIKGKAEKTGFKAPAALRVCNVLFDKHPDEAAADLAATGCFLDDRHSGRNHQMVDEKDVIGVECANTAGITSTSTDELDLEKLAQKPKAASRCGKFRNISTPLLSVRQFDEEAGLAAVLHNKQVTVIGPKDKDFEIAGDAILKGGLKSNGLHVTKLHDTVVTNDCPHPTFKNMGSPPDEHTQH